MHNQTNISTLTLIKSDNSDTIETAVNKYYKLNMSIKKLEEEKSRLYAYIKNFMIDHNHEKYFTSDHEVQLIKSERQSLSKDLLKEIGIDQETLDLCTNKTEFVQLRIK